MQVQRPSFIQEQKLKMNPQLYQSIKLMELPIVELREKISEEIEKNPALEALEDPTTVSIDAAVSEDKEEDDYFDLAGSDFTGSRDDEKRSFIEGVLSRSATLQEHLLRQLSLEPVDSETRRICEILIQNLDDNGFHKEPPDSLFSRIPVGTPELAKALALVRSLDPQGCCTSGYAESLRVQAGLLPDAPPGLIDALDYLELLEKGKFAEVAKKLNKTETEIRELYGKIKELAPFPGRLFSAAPNIRYVVPDVQVIRKEGEFVIVLNEEEIPVLGINPFFMKIVDVRSGDKGSSREARDFARENIKEARWFIQSINQRNHTLLRVSRAIVEFQRAFFVNGPKYLAPLTLSDIARELGIHETTVSRTAGGKYMQTEWGTFELRYFFTNSISGAGSGGSRYSKEGVKEIIRELIGSENRSFSDKEIADQLARRGIALARRTVAKYRKELDLGSSYTR